MPRRKAAGFNMNLTEYDFGGERYMRTGEIITEAEIEKLRTTMPYTWARSGHPMSRRGFSKGPAAQDAVRYGSVHQLAA